MSLKNQFSKFSHKLFGSNSIIRLFEKLSGTKAYKTLPLGLEPLLDIKYSIPNYQIKTIIDVGANVGQSEKHFAHHAPKALIHCIEPIQTTFSLLIKNKVGKNTKCHCLALGEKNESIEIKIDKNTPLVSNSLIAKNTESSTNFYVEKIKVQTLSDFALKNNIQHINLLKIDTEGFDLKVLKGGESLLESKAIDFIEVEVSMNSFNTFHVSFQEISSYLDGYGYHKFGIYEQIHDFKLQKPILRRCNVMFISEKMINP